MPTPRTLLRLGRIAAVSLTLALTRCATHPSAQGWRIKLRHIWPVANVAH
jgi:hypothetical protein